MGYKIPRPTELGYYDLRDVEVRKKQGELAKEYGIDGFIYHTYWFYDPSHPGPNLHAPLMNMLKDGHPDRPFLLNWCSVKWVNVWMGRPIFQSKKVNINKNNALLLQDQFFNATDDMIKDHYVWLSQFFRHKNYIKVGGEPVFLAYQYSPEMMPVLETLRRFAIEDGFPGLYLVLGRSAQPNHIHDPTDLDERLTKMMAKRAQPISMFPEGDVINQTMAYPYPLEYLHRPLLLPKWCGSKTAIPAYPQYQRNKPEIYSLPVTFDNTPRREFATANTWNVGEPANVTARFRQSLEAALTFDACCWGEDHRKRHPEERFVVINAWNEWGEGMALEPSDVYGRTLLEAVRDVKSIVSGRQCRSPFLVGNHT